MVPPNSRARASAAADLPLAVGPTIAMALGCRSASLVIASRRKQDAGFPRLAAYLHVPPRRARYSSRADASPPHNIIVPHVSAALPPNQTDCLAPPVACDIPVGDVSDAAVNAARVALRDRPIDLNVVTAENRRKRLLVADMEST